MVLRPARRVILQEQKPSQASIARLRSLDEDLVHTGRGEAEPVENWRTFLGCFLGPKGMHSHIQPPCSKVEAPSLPRLGGRSCYFFTAGGIEKGEKTNSMQVWAGLLRPENSSTL